VAASAGATSEAVRPAHSKHDAKRVLTSFFS
jgi:hypothetical protein